MSPLTKEEIDALLGSVPAGQDLHPIDKDGFPCTVGEDNLPDGGDTAAILGTIGALDGKFTGLWARFDYLIPNDIPIRHPDWNRWYGREDRFSRDQLIPIICSAIQIVALTFTWDKFYAAHRRRWFLTAWNSKGNGRMDAPSKFPDITGPQVWALWIRFKRPGWARLVLWVLDLESLISALHWRFLRKDRVTRNHMLTSIICRRHLPTLASRLTYRINRWPDLIGRWRAHCEAVREYQTADLFEEAIKR